MNKYRHRCLFILLFFLLLVSCSNMVPGDSNAVTPENNVELVQTKTSTVKAPTVIPTATPTAVATAVAMPTQTPRMIPVELSVAIPKAWQALIGEVYLPESHSAELKFCEVEEEVFWQGEYVYAVTASFPTVRDNLTSEAVGLFWRGDVESKPGAISVIIIDPETHAVMSGWLGESAPANVQVIDREAILDFLWGHEDSIAILPFQEIDPRMKVLSVDGVNPLFTTVTKEEYPFTVNFCITGGAEASEAQGAIAFTLPSTNRDLSKMTSVLMTGVTAMVRDTAYKMETNGILYPAQDVIDWFLMADLAHVSNEVPFYTDCPLAVPARRTSRFCSDPTYIELLTYLGVDIVELTGNHLMDYGREAFEETLALYQQHNLKIFGSGGNLTQSREPLLLEHNGNRFAFLGCIAAGPESVYAEESLPGVNPCNMALMEPQIQSLAEDGYLVIVGVQHFESCQFQPTSGQRADFGRLAQAGATVVSGSQAHCPQAMTFVEDRFVHYGLGNLFFDQMWDLYRDGFLDYHVFYDGQYLGVQLLTTRLEDASRPRPMTEAERSALLETIFIHSEWGRE